MKITFYVDMWPGICPEVNNLFAVTRPSKKSEGLKRFAFDVVISDDVLNGVDGRAVEVTSPVEKD